MDFPRILSDTYHIEAELSSGSSGAVYKAWHKRLQKYVVIKEFNYNPSVSEESRRNEVEALKNVKNAHLPQVFDYLSEYERSFTVIEFIEGESFDKLLGRGQRFSQYRVVEWYDQLASALVELHGRDICHGDIKPANVMLMPNGKVCLIDYNSAKVKGNNAQLVSCSKDYASPEQFELYERFKNVDEAECQDYKESDASAFHDVKTVLIVGDVTVFFANNSESIIPQAYKIDWKLSDIYNLGATIYHILNGNPIGNNTEEKNIRFGSRKRQMNRCGKEDEISPCQFIIERSTHINPNNRFASATALSRTIRSILSV